MAPDNGRLAGRTILITGAASGIGAAAAKRLTAEGALVLLADIDGPGAEKLATSTPRGDFGSVISWPGRRSEIIQPDPGGSRTVLESPVKSRV